MAKSKTRFANPDKWSPTAAREMTRSNDGNWIRESDYRELELAYRFALVQLDRAAEHVAKAIANRE